MPSAGRQFTGAGLNFCVESVSALGSRELTVSHTCGLVQAEMTGGLFVHAVRGPRGLALVSYGAEIASPIAHDCFAWLDAPVRRIGSTDPFVGYAPRSRGTS
jgi:hypothetical protein